LRGKTVDEALAIKNTDIVNELSCRPVKIHCSVLAEDAIKAASAITRARLPRGWKRRGLNTRRFVQRMVTVTPKAVDKIRAAFQREGVSGGLRLGVLVADVRA